MLVRVFTVSCALWLSAQVDTLKITDDDAAFILGKGGKTKEKQLSAIQYPCKLVGDTARRVVTIRSTGSTRNPRDPKKSQPFAIPIWSRCIPV